MTVNASSRHLCSTDARITLVNRGSNGNSDIVRPSVVSCGGDPFKKNIRILLYISIRTTSVIHIMFNIMEQRFYANNC